MHADSKDLIAIKEYCQQTEPGASYITMDTFEKAYLKQFGVDKCFVTSIIGLTQKACAASQGNVSLHKFNAMIDLIGQYHILRRGQIKDSNDLYKVLSSQKKKSAGDYSIQFSKSPHGVQLGTAAKKNYFDPALLADDSKVEEWVHLFQKKLMAKFNSINDAFRHFDICQTGRIDYK